MWQLTCFDSHLEQAEIKACEYIPYKYAHSHTIIIITNKSFQEQLFSSEKYVLLPMHICHYGCQIFTR